MSKPENTAPVRADILTRFQPGNPGKPKGARNKLQEDFLKDILAAWEKSGSEAIDAMIADKPGDFVKVVASLMPKEATLNLRNDDLSDEELRERIAGLASQLAPFLVGGAGDSADMERKAISSNVH